MSNGRQGYEFDFGVKKYALERANYRCEVCGTKGTRKNRLEVHHKIAIWVAKQYPFIAPVVIKHIANAQVLCHDCHVKHHQEHTTPEDYEEIIQEVLETYAGTIIYMVKKVNENGKGL